MRTQKTKILADVNGEQAVIYFLGATVRDLGDVQKIMDEIEDVAYNSKIKLLVINFSRVTQLTSAFLGRLITLNKSLKQAGITLRLCSMTPQVEEAFQICKFQKLIPLYPSRRKGARRMRPPSVIRRPEPGRRAPVRCAKGALESVKGRQVTILGLGLFGGGAGAARYFAERGARVIVSDLRDAAALAESLEALEGLPIEFRLGPRSGGEEDFAGSDLVVVNPAVPPDSPALATAQRCGARLEAEINLLLRLCPAPVAAVTGTNGKSTTVALLGEMMRRTGRKTWVGGNLGGSLLPQVDEMAAGDIVVIEISSFQSQRLAWAGLSPHLGAVLNLTPNHLDRHRDMAEYAEAKRQLLLHQGPGDFAVLNGEDPVLRRWTDAGRGRKLFFGAEPQAPAGIRLDGDDGPALARRATRGDLARADADSRRAQPVQRRLRRGLGLAARRGAARRSRRRSPPSRACRTASSSSRNPAASATTTIRSRRRRSPPWSRSRRSASRSC